MWTNSFRELGNCYTPHFDAFRREGQSDSLHHTSKMGESCNLLEVHTKSKSLTCFRRERHCVAVVPFSVLVSGGNDGKQRSGARLLGLVDPSSEGTRRKWSAAATDGWPKKERDCGGDSGDAVLSKWRIVNAKHIGWYGTGWDGDHIPLQTPFGQQNINLIELHGPPYLRSVIN